MVRETLTAPTVIDATTSSCVVGTLAIVSSSVSATPPAPITIPFCDLPAIGPTPAATRDIAAGEPLLIVEKPVSVTNSSRAIAVYRLNSQNIPQQIVGRQDLLLDGDGHFPLRDLTRPYLPRIRQADVLIARVLAQLSLDSLRRHGRALVTWENQVRSTVLRSDTPADVSWQDVIRVAVDAWQEGHELFRIASPTQIYQMSGTVPSGAHLTDAVPINVYDYGLDIIRLDLVPRLTRTARCSD